MQTNLERSCTFRSFGHFYIDGPIFELFFSSVVLQRRFFEGTRMITGNKILEGVSILQKGILKLVRINPAGVTISDAFLRWMYGVNICENLPELIEGIFGVVKNRTIHCLWHSSGVRRMAVHFEKTETHDLFPVWFRHKGIVRRMQIC